MYLSTIPLFIPVKSQDSTTKMKQMSTSTAYVLSKSTWKSVHCRFSARRIENAAWATPRRHRGSAHTKSRSQVCHPEMPWWATWKKHLCNVISHHHQLAEKGAGALLLARAAVKHHRTTTTSDTDFQQRQRRFWLRFSWHESW